MRSRAWPRNASGIRLLSGGGSRSKSYRTEPLSHRSPVEVVLDVLPGRVLPALTLMALLGSLGFAGWIMTAGRRPGGAVARSGLVTFLMLFGLAASPAPFDISVLDRIGDIGVLSLYTVGATALLLPPTDPRWPTAVVGGSAHRS